MSAALLGMLAGAGAGAGVLTVVWGSPPVRRNGLYDRVAPFVSDVIPDRRKQLGAQAGWQGKLRQGVGAAAGRLDTLLGGSSSVRKRLAALGSDLTQQQFRVEQVIWGCVGAAAALLGTLLLTVLAGSTNPVSLLLALLGGAVTGVQCRDWALTRRVRIRSERIMAELPAVADLLALALTAGEGPLSAISRVCSVGQGELVMDFRRVLADVRAGQRLTVALDSLRDATWCPALARLLDALVVGLERGTPLADLIRAQAGDVRQASRRALIEAGGRREILMLVPVVFLVLPVTVVFAMYPGFISLVSLSQ